MRKFLLRAAVSLAFFVFWVNDTTSAPIPKAPEPPAISGTYTLQYTTARTIGGKKGAAVPATTFTLSPVHDATITRNEIVYSSKSSRSSPSGFSSSSSLNATSEMAMTYTIDPTKTPMTIDVVTTDIRNRKTTSKGIIEVSDDRITIALAREGTERPKTMDESEDVTVYYFKKAPPPPRVEFRIVAMTVGKEAEAEKELNKLAKEGYELVSTTNPAATDPKAAATTVHFVLKRTVKSP